jgi:hypothetical protein
MSEFFQLLQSNPVLGFSGVVASILGFIIGIPLTIYLYRRGNKRRGLTYRVHPVRTPIVRAGAASRLAVVHDGRQIKSDITAVHIAIWNQGRESIHQTDMLRPLTIETEHHAPILEATIQMVTRGVIDLGLDESQFHQGRLNVSWKILEQRDGGIVQIIYAGSPDLRIAAHAVPEGQQQIIGYSRHVPPVPGLERQLFLALLFMVAGVASEAFLNIAELLQIYPFVGEYARQPSWGLSWVVGCNIFSLLLVSGTAILVLSRLQQTKPPFGF